MRHDSNPCWYYEEMKTAIILHGTLGSPDGNWFQWLKSELENHGLQVWLPQLPHAEQPSLNEWYKFIQEECPFAINEDTLIVGHSSGAILALIIAQDNMEKVGAIVDVSVFHDNSLQWEPNNKLFDRQFDWTVIREGAKELLFIHSDNDPYVPLDQAQYVATNCGAELELIPDQGHFNLEKSENYRQFPKLLELMEQKGIL
jgi:predicted alpha/beta hydrolase family esterase